MVPGKIFKSIGVYGILVSAFMTRCSLLILTYYIVRSSLSLSLAPSLFPPCLSFPARTRSGTD